MTLTAPLSTPVTVQPDSTDPTKKLSISWTKTNGNPDGLTYKVYIDGTSLAHTADSSPYTIPEELNPGTEYTVVFWSEVGKTSSSNSTAKSYTGK